MQAFIVVISNNHKRATVWSFSIAIYRRSSSRKHARTAGRHCLRKFLRARENTERAREKERLLRNRDIMYRNYNSPTQEFETQHDITRRSLWGSAIYAHHRTYFARFALWPRSLKLRSNKNDVTTESARKARIFPSCVCKRKDCIFIDFSLPLFLFSYII